jgi:hypothetical protein
MATITPKFSLTGNTSDFGSPLALSVFDSLNVGEPFSAPSRKSISISTKESFSSDLTAAGQAVRTFVYLKNMDSTNFITISLEAASTDFIVLEPGEFAFFPLKGGVGLHALSNTTTCILEYAYYSEVVVQP